MTHALERHAYDPRPAEVRRLKLAAITLILLSICWHTLRPFAVRRLACSSVGCPGRARLLTAAIRATDPTFPPEEHLFPTYEGSGHHNIGTHSLPRPGWVAWRSLRASIPIGPRAYLPQFSLTVADHLLRKRGSVACNEWMILSPGDMDGDGLWEIGFEFPGSPLQHYPAQDLRRWAVIRLGSPMNQVVWAALVDEKRWTRGGVRIKPIWRDEDDDGINELAVITVATVRLPDGGIAFKPPTTVAVFEWDHPGGRLRPRILPKTAGILPWAPPDGGVFPIAPDDDLGSLLGKLLPIPAAFPTSQPSEPPTTRPRDPAVQ